MNHLFLEAEVAARPNGQRVSRLLREMQSTCEVERRRKRSKPFLGPERRAPGNVQPAGTGAAPP